VWTSVKEEKERDRERVRLEHFSDFFFHKTAIFMKMFARFIWQNLRSSRDIQMLQCSQTSGLSRGAYLSFMTNSHLIAHDVICQQFDNRSMNTSRRNVTNYRHIRARKSNRHRLSARQNLFIEHAMQCFDNYPDAQRRTRRFRGKTTTQQSCDSMSEVDRDRLLFVISRCKDNNFTHLPSYTGNKLIKWNSCRRKAENDRKIKRRI